MPRGDGLGPNGMGSMTGRAAGFCAGSSVPGFANATSGRGGLGRGAGFGRGFGGGRRFGAAVNSYGNGMAFAPAVAPQQELDGLNSQAEYLEGALTEIKNRIEALESSK